MKTFQFLLALASCLSLGFRSAAAPAISNVSPVPGNIVALTQITVTFSVPVTNVVGPDLLVNGLPADTVSGGGAVYTFTLAGAPAYGTVEIAWDAAHNILDLAQPPARFDENGAGATWSYNLIDTAPPAIASLAPVQGVSVRSLTQIEVNFSEAVLGVDAGDLLINGLPASGLSVLGAGKYLFTFTQPTSGTVQVSWAANHEIRDFAATPNHFAGGGWTYVLDPNLGLPSIRINEFVAANISGLADEDTPAEPQDWIEIWNYGTSPVNLNGYSLTDDKDDPGRWIFPSTNLAPGQFLVVFASEKDRRTITNPAHRFHTNFRLNPGGEYLALFNAESPRVAISEFAPEYPEQRNNISFGYDSTDALKHFITPTPGLANGASQISGVLPPPHFNVDRGLFEQPFTLILSSTEPGATIRYTLDATEPTATSGLVYDGPLTVTNNTVMRAAAFGVDVLPSVTVTHTYLFLDEIVHQSNTPAGFPSSWGTKSGFPNNIVPADYEMDMDPLRVDPNNTNSPIDQVKLQRLKDGLRELPIVSIVMTMDDLFGPAGLHQRSAVDTANKPDNKKPCSVEMVLPDGTTAFATTCGIDMHGNASRNPLKNPKHGFKLKFRGDFGPPSLNYRLFEDSSVEEFDDLILRADFGTSWRHWSDVSTQGLGAFQRTRGTRTRDAWIKHSMRDLGGVASHNRFFHLYLNGAYWGTYEFSEQPTETFAKTLLGGTGADYDIVDQGTVREGTTAAYNAMVALPAATTLAQYEAYSQHLNIPEYTDYMILHYFVGHQDWSTAVTKNWYAIRKRVAGAEGTFRYIPWDGENILLDENVNRVTSTTPPSGLHTKLDDSPEYRLFFADRVYRNMIAADGALTPAANIARWKYWESVMDKPIVAESARWGDYRRDVHRYQDGVYQLYTRENHWFAENARVLGYFSNRNATVLTQFRNANLYPSVNAPIFNQHGGALVPGFNLTMTAPNTIYYTLDGTDPRTYGTGAISPGASTYSGPVVLNNSVVVKARARSGSTWSALAEATFTLDALGSPLRITEIMYNPIGGDAYEFIEVRNVGPLPVNVGHYFIDGLNFVFPPSTILAAGQVVVLGSAASPGNWDARYPGVTVFGRYDGKLDNGGEKLGIRDAAGRLLWSVDYDDENGWPKSADGGGFSIEIIDTFGDPDAPANWRASVAQNGTPGTITPPPAQGLVLINEVMAENGLAVNNGGFYPDWIELHNPGAQTVNLAGWSLTDDSNPRKFVFPSGTTIAAGAYLVVWCDANPAVPGLRASFGLGQKGDSVFLYDATTNRVDAVSFGLQLPTHTVGRVAGDWRLNLPTPGAANAAATTASTTGLIINEWLANSAPGEDDWLELHNRSTTAPVALKGIYLASGAVLHQLNALSFIAPGGYAQFFADEQSGANNLDFTLPLVGGTIFLYNALGAELDRVTYGPQAEGVSQGRFPDASANITSFPSSASPASSNYLLASYSGAILNEVLAINRAAVTNDSGRTADFVELRNTNNTPFSVAGMRLSTAPENSSQWIFPAGVSVPANGYLVVWFDDEQPASTNNSALLNTGRSLDGESDEVWLFNTVGQPVDSVTFGFQIADKSIGRTASGWKLLAVVTVGANNSAAAALGATSSLRINEWMASPVNGNDWFEVYNGASQPVALAGLYLSDNPSSQGLTQFEISPLSFIGARGFVKFVADASAGDGRNHVNFNLDGQGEALRIASPAVGVIDTVSFGAQIPGVSEGRLPDGANNFASFPGAATPAESNYLPHPGVVINEVLTHTDAPLEDAIELYNRSGQGTDLSGWFLSDSVGDFKKYRIPNGTFLSAGGYRVFYEAQFNSGAPGSFTLDSAGGDLVILSEADSAGNLTGYRAAVRFGAANNGVSFGRHESCNGVDFVPMSQRTFGQDNPASLTQFRTGNGLFNTYPKIGPVVINEIMYHPAGTGTNDNVLDEYIELHNVSASVVNLFDAANPANTWRLRDGVSFAFPQGTTIPAGGHVLVVNFDPVTDLAQATTFRARFGVPSGVSVHGPLSGKLDNGGESVELQQPDSPQAGTGFVPYLIVDRIEYGDSAPWPTGADGDGASLQRKVATDFGNDAANWSAAGPTAGRANLSQPAQAPSIVTQPVSRAVSIGSRVVFSVAVCGTRPLNYQWRFNGANVAGATGASLVLPTAQAGDAGNYTVLVSNGAGNVLSEVASLSFMNPPVITTQPQPQTAGGGGEAAFSVSATGSGPLSYQWRRNGVALAGATNATLDLINLRLGDSGGYSVLVMNPAGAIASATALLNVLVPPAISLQPQDQIVDPGANVVFTVGASGVGTIRYQWQFNGEDIPGATSASYTVANAQLADEGDYRVIVTDDVTFGPSQVARLTVKVPPVILVGPVGVTNYVGSSFTLSVTASGSLPMGVQWRRGALPLTNYSVMTTNIEFTLFNAQTVDSGTYRIILTNSGSRPPGITTTAIVSILPPPIILLQDVQWLPDGTAKMSISGAANRSYAIETSGNLTNWATLTTVFYTNGLMPFIDTTTSGTTNRFYRARLVQ